MKKSKTVRILCMALALLLISQFAVTAFAATSSSWLQDGYWHYMETYRSGTNRTRSNGAVSTTSFYHDSGTVTQLVGYTDMYCYENWQGMDYGDIVITTAAKDGYSYTYTKRNVELDGGFEIPAYEPSGNYKAVANSFCHEISYVVYRDEGWGYTNYMAGTVYAPYDVDDFYSYRLA